jgi:hypothetical protein
MRLPFFVAAATGRRLLMSPLVVGGDALQAADRDGLRRFRRFLNTSAAAGGLAWTIAGAPEDTGKHVRMPIDHVGVAVTLSGDQSDVFGDGRMGRARPLTIDDLVEIIGVLDVGWFHPRALARSRGKPISGVPVSRSDAHI